MIGDVWLEEDSDGKVFLCIGIGNGQVSKKEIKKKVKNKIQTKTNNQR